MLKRLNNKGFTLIEVLTVIVVITSVMMITIPMIGSITKKNQMELYHSYETMMEEYAIASNIKDKDKIMLSELDDLDMVKKECEGYVDINEGSPRNYKAYIKCGEKYKTDGYGSTMQSTGTIESCPGCKFMYSTNTMYTTWNTSNKVPTKITSGLYDNYEELIETTGENYFLGVKLNSNNQVTNAYACGIKDNVPFCIEGTKDGSKYAANQMILQGASLWNNTCTVKEYCIECGPFDYSNILSAGTYSIGIVNVFLTDADGCIVVHDGEFHCSS